MSDKTRARSRSEEKHQRILEVAMDQFSTQGFVATSMDTIAKEADVSKQTVYSHFGSKEELFMRSIHQKCSESALFNLPLDPTAPVRDTLLSFARVFVELALSDSAVRVMRTCVATAENMPELARAFYEAGPAVVSGNLREYLKALNDNGCLRIARPEHAAVQLPTMLLGDQRLKRELALVDEPLDASYDIYLQDCIDMFLRAYAA